MKHATTRDLYCYWDKLRGERPAPERIDVDPAAIRRVLGDTFISEVDLAGRFPFRLAGTRMCALMGQELRGTSMLRPWNDTDQRELRRLLGAVTEESSALVLGILAWSNHGESLDIEMLALPLRHMGSRQARILGSMTPGEYPQWVGLHPITQMTMRSVRLIPHTAHFADILEPVSPPMPYGARRVGHLTVVEGGRR